MIKNNKAFTIIELIVVIAVIGILVLLAAPKLLGYTKDAKLTQIKNDVRAVEQSIEAERIFNDDFFKDWRQLNKSNLEMYKNENSLYDKKGLLSSSYEFKDEYFKVNMRETGVKTKLKGDFIFSKGGKVYYYEESGEASEETVYLAQDEDFEWIPNDGGYEAIGKDGKGIFWYKGKYSGERVIEIPHVIQGNPMTSYVGMFLPASEEELKKTIEIDKIISTNENITDISSMFSNAIFERLDLSEFESKSIVKMDATFSMMSDNAGVREVVGVENWNLSSLESMTLIFYNSSIDNILDIYKKWGDNGYLNKLTSYANMFTIGPIKGVINVNDIFENVDMSNVTDLTLMFSGTKASSIIFGENFDISNVKNMDRMFFGVDVDSIVFTEHFDTSNVENMSGMFYESKVETLDLSTFRTENVDNMSVMFTDSKSKELDLSSFDTSNIRTMSSMFKGSAAKSITFSENFKTHNVTSPVLGMQMMFKDSQVEYLDLSSFDTSNVRSMGYMFDSSKVKSIIFGENFKTHNVTSSLYMFRNSLVETLDLSSFDTKNMKLHNDMFLDAATEEVYVRTKDDADRLGSLSGNPESLEFILKN